MDKQTKRAIKALQRAIRKLKHGAECSLVTTKTKTESSCYGEKRYTRIMVMLFDSKPGDEQEREDEIEY